MSIINQEDLKHEIAVDENLWLIRWYHFLWGQNATLDFCHLFWGTLFSPLAATILAVTWPFRTVAVLLFGSLHERLKEIERRHQSEQAALSCEPETEPKEKRRSRALDWIGVTASKVSLALDRGFEEPSMFLRINAIFVAGYLAAISAVIVLSGGATEQSAQLADIPGGGKQTLHDTTVTGPTAIGLGLGLCLEVFFFGAVFLPMNKHVARAYKVTGRGIAKSYRGIAGVARLWPVRWGALGLGAAATSGGVTYGLLWVPSFAWQMAGEIAVGAVTFAVIILTLAAVITTFGDRLESAGHWSWRNVTRAVTRFGRSVRAGWCLFIFCYRAVKTNTCPRIEVRSKPEDQVRIGS